MAWSGLGLPVASGQSGCHLPASESARMARRTRGVAFVNGAVRFAARRSLWCKKEGDENASNRVHSS